MVKELRKEASGSKTKRLPIWIIIVAIAIIAVMVIGVAAAKSMSPEIRAARQREFARKYVSELNYEQAIIAYEAAIKIYPRSVAAYIELADVYEEIGESELAQEVLEEALSGAVKEDVKKVEQKQKELGTTSSVPAPKPTDTGQPAPTQMLESVLQFGYLTAAKTGDIISFGTYEQDNIVSNGQEPIEWIVLYNNGSELYVLSKNALDCKPYNEERTDVTWETCTLRRWLNEDFFYIAFNNTEQSVIKNTIVKNADNPLFGTVGGNDTKDKVFLPSVADMVNTDYGFISEYAFSDGDDDDKMINRRCAPTLFAKEHGIWTSDSYMTAYYDHSCNWWLRSPGDSTHGAMLMTGSGSIYVSGDYVSTNDLGVRPALIINLNP